MVESPGATHLSSALKAYISGVVVTSALALAAATLLFPATSYPDIALDVVPGVGPTNLEFLAGIAFWTLLTLVSWALPVRLPHGTQQAVANAPMLAAIFLGGPAVGGWVAMLGTTEVRELRGEVPWYGILANRASIVIPAILAGLTYELIPLGGAGIGFLVKAMVAGVVFYLLNVLLAGILVALRSESSI